MRRIIASILLVSYVAMSTGVLVNFHYCMDRLDSAKIFESKSDTCGKCGMHIGTSEGCCRDEVQLIKITDDQRFAGDVVFQLPALAALEYTPSPFFETIGFLPQGNKPAPVISPPLRTAPDLGITYCVFRI